MLDKDPETQHDLLDQGDWALGAQVIEKGEVRQVSGGRREGAGP